MEKEKDNGTLLYEKMQAEQEKYKSWLAAQPAGEILNHAYEYSVREDFLFAMEYMEITEERAGALLASPSPLADAYRIWGKREGSHMEEIESAIADCADRLITRGSPVMPGTG